ncbi:carboxypeptidase-like regulatory domain-containing protein [Pedobacter foliorum]|uniref:carboxypeptidase-like regulatory domain-containing protein n=1 Tax=Pedobacter foliorum TaxID=2739058 RepID=UPI0015651A31|nr:carboxypeptidase-like regulatory domain-containing protein [Pedobacter foliorum]NRF39129.1 carboxypeptidase-like regulatory domain-containing protein [Pedobacter foliorum]
MLNIKLMLIFPILLFLATDLSGQKMQKSYVGQIIDSKTTKPIAKVNVRLMPKNILTQTDIKGNFTLISPENKPSDSIIVSCVGYKAIRIALSELPSDKIIALVEDVATLKGLSIYAKKSKTMTINKSSETIHYTPGSNMFTAQMMKCPEAGGFLESIKIKRSVTPDVLNPQTKFIVRVYDLDEKTGGPGKELLPDGYLVTNKDDRTINIDLSSYHIVPSKKIFFVGIERLFIPFNEYPQDKVEELTEAIDKNGKVIPWTSYLGNSSYIIATMDNRGETLEEYQIAIGAPEKDLIHRGLKSRPIKTNVSTINYFYQPILRAIPGEEPGYVWIKENNLSTWRPYNYLTGEKLAISATLKY